VEESPCELKHGEGGPMEELELSLAAPAAAGSHVREKGAGWSRVSI